MDQEELISIAEQFSLSDEIRNISSLGEGHIHDTYKVMGEEHSFVLQKFNNKVFTQPYKVAENIQTIAQHLEHKLQSSNVSDFWRRYLPPLTLVSDESTLLKKKDSYWRMFPYIQHSYEIQVVENPEQAYEVARTVGRFQALLSDLPVENLHITLPDFHSLPRRYQQFEQALQHAAKDRKEKAKSAIQAVQQYQSFIQRDPVFLQKDFLPLRVTHNDTKVNNALLDKTTHEGLCMIDLDTVMPGYVIHDFGDMVRTFCSPVDENSRELGKVVIRKPIFEALVSGYLKEADSFLTDREKEYLFHGGKQMTLITAIRFLTDYLAGDVYYKTHYEGQNLQRSLNQLKLLSELILQENELQEIILNPS